jgi:hypothetical protein
MNGRIIFMTEEPSMGQTLRILLPRIFQDFREFEHWLVINHQGKSDLEQSFPKKMLNWQEPGVRFIILRDNDGGDCRALKERLVSKAPAGVSGFQVRIVCQELESWFLGDMEAVAAAYPAAGRHAQFKSLSKLEPDRLTNASDLIQKLTGTGAKVRRAEEIAQHMKPPLNKSSSFQVFLSGVSRFFTH